MKKITLLSLMLLLTISHAKEEIPDTIQVGLSYGTSAVSSFTVSATSGVKIDGTTYKGTVTIEKSGTIIGRAIWHVFLHLPFHCHFYIPYPIQIAEM